MEQFKQMKLSLGIVMAIVAQSFGGIWYVAQLDSTVSNTESAVIAIEEAIGEMDERIDVLEGDNLIILNEYRTIMAEHATINQILRELGLGAYGDTRRYGDYRNE